MDRILKAISENVTRFIASDNMERGTVRIINMAKNTVIRDNLCTEYFFALF